MCYYGYTSLKSGEDMPFCSFEESNQNNSFVMLDNNFITSFMPECNDLEIKVYLYGLYLCQSPLSKDNTIEHIKDALSLSLKEIQDIFYALEQKGLVSIISFDPFQVAFKRAKNLQASKLYKKEKYSDFNKQLEECFPDKMLVNPNQYTVFYDFIESTNIQPGALIMIVKHCVNVKGSTVSSNYILQVAQSWVNDGIRSEEEVSKRIRQRELNSGYLKDISTEIGKTSQITEEDKDYFTKWTENWGFDIQAILAACKKSLKSMAKLDAILDDCFKNGAISAVEVEAYLKNKKKLSENALNVAKELGLWYDNPAPVVENYISPWQQKGFSSEGLLLIAKYCFRNSIKELKYMDHVVNDFFNKGIISEEAIKIYFEQLDKEEELIKKLLATLGSSRIVTQNDREMLNVWTNTWGFSYDTIFAVAKLCVGKPLGECAKKLSILMSNGIFDASSVETFFNNEKKVKANRFTESDRPYDKAAVESSLISDDELGNIEM